MSEFKGTQGNWYSMEIPTRVINEESAIVAVVYDGKGNAFDNLLQDEDVKKYNALLISKAPKMLELLQHFVRENMLSSYGDELAEQLIKECTE